MVIGAVNGVAQASNSQSNCLTGCEAAARSLYHWARGGLQLNRLTKFAALAALAAPLQFRIHSPARPKPHRSPPPANNKWKLVPSECLIRGQRRGPFLLA
jgi:hypothetical protein